MYIPTCRTAAEGFSIWLTSSIEFVIIISSKGNNTMKKMIKVYETIHHRTYLVPVDEVDMLSSFGTFLNFKSLRNGHNPITLKSLDGKRKTTAYSMEVGFHFWDNIRTRKDLFQKYGIEEN